MAISQFYKDNSVEKSFNIPSISPFTFKCTNDLSTLFSDNFDDTIAFSSNELPFYHNFQYSNQFQYFTDYQTGTRLTLNPDFVKLETKSTKICLLYSEYNIDSQYTDELTNWYLYDNKKKEQTYNNLQDFSSFRIVTEFPFDRIVCSVAFADRKYDKTQPFSYYDTFVGDNNFNKAIIQLWYRNDDYTLTNISGNFVLAELIKTDDNTLLNMLSFRNILGEQNYSSGSIDIAEKYTNDCAHTDDNYFMHIVTSDILVDTDNIQRYVADDDNTGLWNVFNYSWGYHVYYNITVNKHLAVNICSALGLRFITCSPDIITDKNSYDENIKLAYMDDSGYVDYKNIIVGSEEIENSNTYNKNIDLNTSPDIPDTPNPYPKEDDKINPVDYRFVNEIGGFTRYYKVSREQIAAIITKINTAEDIPEGYEFLPHIVSVRQYPFNTSQYAMGHSENIVIGGYNTGVTGLNLDSTLMGVHSIAHITIPNKYNTFLDKSPYTQLSLFIPCCGWVDLPDICVGRTIDVELAHDIINGGCIGIVKLNGMPIVQASGKMGTDISISAIENGLKQAALTQSAFAVGGGVLSTGFALATANPVGVFSGIMSTASALSQGNIANNSNYTHQIGCTGDKSNDHISTKCYLRISFPITDIPQNFGHVYGYVCNQTHIISECEGFTVCDRVDLTGISATDNEKNRLKQILETGFYC